MIEFWNKKGWNKGELNGDFRKECLDWIMLLVKIIQITDPGTPKNLKELLTGKKGTVIVDNDFRADVVQEIRNKTRESFQYLTIDMFYPLYNEYRIWPASVRKQF